MYDPDESKRLAKSFSDKSRKVTRLGRQFIVPHKFTEDGKIPRTSQEVVISKLNLNDLRFLQIWRDNKWNDEATLKALQLPPEQAAKTFKKLAYFKTEDARIKALASEATPERVLAKDVENIEVGNLNDSQHKSLDRVAKTLGMFKTTADVNVTHTLNVPKLDPAVWDAIRQIADQQADVIDAEVA